LNSPTQAKEGLEWATRFHSNPISSMIRLAHGEEEVGVDDHLRSGDDDVVGAAARADRSVAFVPEVGDVGVGEEPVAVGATAGRIGSFGLAVEIAWHGIEHNTEEKRVASRREIHATQNVE
jgi:hypothetical protein